MSVCQRQDRVERGGCCQEMYRQRSWTERKKLKCVRGHKRQLLGIFWELPTNDG